ncbi:MAG: RcpC/CpaB family pilus assembly protein [Actinomycetota bacterium]|nr:RcpC/CpaB family pilus assembly protein [Actinomycetota bacterium]
MIRRIITILVAIVLALVGTGAVLIYVRQANQRALAGQKAVTTLVASRQIPAGTSVGLALKDGMLTPEKLPAASVPPNAVRAISPALGTLVLSTDVASGQLLLRPMLVTSVTASSGLAIPARDIAVTIALCVPQAVAGFVTAGSQVAIFDTVVTSGSASSGCNSGSASSSSKNNVYTRVLLPRVTVLAIGQAASTGTASVPGTTLQNSNSGGAGNGTVLVTLAVTQTDAERVITLAQAGIPYLALLGPSSVIGPDHGPTTLIPPYK